MRYITNYDIIKSRYNQVEDLLLLHPSLIESELSKIEKKCPVYIIDNDKETYNIFIPNKTIEHSKYTDEIKYYIPVNVSIPVGGIDGRFYIKSYGTYVDKSTGLTSNIGYVVIDRNNEQVVFDGRKLRFLGQNIALVDDLIIAKNTIFHSPGDFTYYNPTGYTILHTYNAERTDFIYILYDANGDFVTTGVDYKEIRSIASKGAELPTISYEKNSSLFEQMIITSLKDKKELIDCNADNLIDIVKYLQFKNLDLAIDLDSLKVYKVNYTRYLNNLQINQKEKCLRKVK